MAVGRTRREATRIPAPHGLCSNRINVANHHACQAATHDQLSTSEWAPGASDRKLRDAAWLRP